jgi:hypothetical protein
MKGEGNMNNMKKTISRVMIMALTVGSLMIGISANAASSAIVAPKPTVKGLKATYKYNSVIKFNISTLNYTRKVKYEVSLYNLSTKKSFDLTKGYTTSIGGSKTLVINDPLKTPGKYALRIYVKALANKSGKDKYLEKIFNVEANKSEITSAILNASALEKSVTAGIQIGDALNVDKNKFQSIINESLAVKNNIYANQTLVNTKTQALKAAVMAFKNTIKQPTDKTALTTVIKLAQQKINSITVETQPSEYKLALRIDKNTLSIATADAIKVATDRNATVQSVNEASTKLNTAIGVFKDKLAGIGINL